jgi:hypothetical protein
MMISSYLGSLLDSELGFGSGLIGVGSGFGSGLNGVGSGYCFFIGFFFGFRFTWVWQPG